MTKNIGILYFSGQERCLPAFVLDVVGVEPNPTVEFVYRHECP